MVPLSWFESFSHLNSQINNHRKTPSCPSTYTGVLQQRFSWVGDGLLGKTWCLSQHATELLPRLFSLYSLLFYILSPKEFFGKDRPHQLALNKSITAYQLRNLAHDTEYVISLYVLFGSVEGPGITTSARTCEYRQDVQVATTAHNPCMAGSTLCIPTKPSHRVSCTPLTSPHVGGTVVVVLCPADLLCLVAETVNPKGSGFSAWESSDANWSQCALQWICSCATGLGRASGMNCPTCAHWAFRHPEIKTNGQSLQHCQRVQLEKR